MSHSVETSDAMDVDDDTEDEQSMDVQEDVSVNFLGDSSETNAITLENFNLDLDSAPTNFQEDVQNHQEQKSTTSYKLNESLPKLNHSLIKSMQPLFLKGRMTSLYLSILIFETVGNNLFNEED